MHGRLAKGVAMSSITTAHFPAQPWRPAHWPFRISDGLGFYLRWTARVWLVAATTIFTVMALRGGMPRGLDQESWEVSIQLALFGVVVLGEILAWRWQAMGASVITVGAAGLGALAAIQHSPPEAIMIGQIFFIPAFLYWLDWQRTQPVKTIITLALALSMILGAALYTTYEVYATYMGPSHPESSLTPLPVTVLEWVWSGSLTDDSVSVTARIADDSEAVYLLVSDSSDMSNPERIGPLAASAGENLRVVNFAVDGLDPDTDYYYEVEVDGQVDAARQGQFHTPGVAAHSFSFAAGSCALTDSTGQVYDAIRDLDPLFFLITGDIAYVNIGENDPELFHDAYTTFLTSPAQSALYRSQPTVYMWDDHDYGPNDSDRTSPSREAAQTVYREWAPSYPLAVEGDTGPIYQAFTIGRVRFIVTDGRSEKSPASDPDNAEKSMFGAEQKDWLKQQLLDAKGKYPLIVWVQSVPWIADKEAGADNWGGYTTERAELANFIADNQIEGLLMISGDAHMLAIDDGTNSDYSTSGGAGFPVFHAAPLDRPGNPKGGPYSEGIHTSGGQFGLVTVEDNGATIDVTLSGRTYEEDEVMRYSFTVPAASGE